MLQIRIAKLCLLICAFVITLKGPDYAWLLIAFYGSCELFMWSLDLAYRKIGALIHGPFFMED